MTTIRMIELAAAIIILGAGIWLYRRPRPKGDRDGYGSQGAVILFVVAVLMGIHALGGMDYRPSQSELEMMRSQ
jgi:hypothetical protein